MKQAYVSLVLRWEPDAGADELRHIDRVLTRVARAHEIVLVCSPSERETIEGLGLLRGDRLSGPLTLVVTWNNSSREASIIAGLARAAGDFVVEWNGHPADLSEDMLGQALIATDDGFEIVEFVPERVARVSAAFFALANLFRPRTAPLRATVARLFSRRGLDNALGAADTVANRTLMVADMGLPRVTRTVAVRYRANHSYRDRQGEAFAVLLHGTSAARVLPLVASLVLATFSLGSAAFALAVFVVRGSTPEGWTTLMVVLGLGMATIIVMLTLLYERVDMLTRTSEHLRSVSTVLVVPPTAPSVPSEETRAPGSGQQA